MDFRFWGSRPCVVFCFVFFLVFLRKVGDLIFLRFSLKFMIKPIFLGKWPSLFCLALGFQSYQTFVCASILIHNSQLALFVVVFCVFLVVFLFCFFVCVVFCFVFCCFLCGKWGAVFLRFSLKCMIKSIFLGKWPALFCCAFGLSNYHQCVCASILIHNSQLALWVVVFLCFSCCVFGFVFWLCCFLFCLFAFFEEVGGPDFLDIFPEVHD